jgi:hypothetical protein
MEILIAGVILEFLQDGTAFFSVSAQQGYGMAACSKIFGHGISDARCCSCNYARFFHSGNTFSKSLFPP